MSNCQHCNTILLENARFCHKCGADAKIYKPICPSCNTTNPAGTENCLQCGSNLIAKGSFDPSNYKAKFPLHFKDTNSLPAQIKNHFFKALQKQLQLDYPATNFEDFIDRYYNSDFKPEFEEKANQLAELAYTIHSDQLPTQEMEVDKLLQINYDKLLDHFISQYCKELTGGVVHTSVKSYDKIKSREKDQQQMLVDFFDLENEKLDWYTEASSIHPMKLQNAKESYLFVQPEETIQLICDQTIYGSCREGFALTDMGIYWKSHFTPAQYVQFADLKILEQEGEGVNINNLYFDVSPSINLKMLTYLRIKVSESA